MNEFIQALFVKSASIFVGIVVFLSSFFGVENKTFLAYEKNPVEIGTTTKEIIFSDLEKKEENKQSTETAEEKKDEQKNETDVGVVSVETTEEPLSLVAEETRRLIAELSNIYISSANNFSEEKPMLQVTTLPTEEVNEKIRPATANILCVSKNSGALRPITGSGIVIDQRGIILTNAHVAQYLLLTDSFGEGLISCVARFENSPVTYQIEPLFISGLWIKENKTVITQDSPMGTGQYDYALLAITKPVSEKEKKKDTFDFIEIETNLSQIEKEKHVLLASFPAELLGGITIQKELSLVSSVGEIVDTMTFDENPSQNLDVVAIDGNIISQKGSSGGAIVSLQTGKLIGMISVSSSGKTTSERSLRAITTHHINRAFFEETNTELSQFPSLDIEGQIKLFRETDGAVLHTTLTDVLYQ